MQKKTRRKWLCIYTSHPVVWTPLVSICVTVWWEKSKCPTLFNLLPPRSHIWFGLCFGEPFGVWKTGGGRDKPVTKVKTYMFEESIKICKIYWTDVTQNWSFQNYKLYLYMDYLVTNVVNVWLISIIIIMSTLHNHSCLFI